MKKFVSLLNPPIGAQQTNVATLLVRITLFWIFAYHGSQKLFGWFGGGGLSGTADYFRSVGFSPGHLWATLAGLTEFAGAVLVGLGLLTRLAGVALASEMAIVIVKVNWANGLIAEKAAGGYEINLALAALSLALVILGPGGLSLDARLQKAVAGGRPTRRQSAIN